MIMLTTGVAAKDVAQIAPDAIAEADLYSAGCTYTVVGGFCDTPVPTDLSEIRVVVGLSVCGVFIVHRAHNDGRESTPRWVLTHAATGLALAAMRGDTSYAPNVLVGLGVYCAQRWPKAWPEDITRVDRDVAPLLKVMLDRLGLREALVA